MCYLLKKYFLWLLRWVSRISDRRHVNTTENEMSPTDIFISNWFDICQWSNISKTMLLWSGLLVLRVLMAGFPWNIARPQLHLLSLMVKISDVKPRISHCDHQNLHYKTHPEFWPSLRRILKTSLYYKTRLILETRRWTQNLTTYAKFCINANTKYRYKLTSWQLLNSRYHCGYGLSQWEAMLHSNVGCHWLSLVLP